MNSNGEGWHHQNTKLESHKKVYESEDFCNVVMPSENTKILVFNYTAQKNEVFY